MIALLGQSIGQITSAPVTTNGSSAGSVLGWGLGFLLAIGVVWLVAQPLLRVESEPKLEAKTSPANRELELDGLEDSAAAERQSLKDLELDRELGSIEETTYNELKERSSARLESLNQQIQLLQNNLSAARQRQSQAVAVAETERPANGVKTKTGEYHLKAIIKDKLKCSECATPFKPGDRYCSQCSAPLPRFCLNCGKEVTDKDRFCAKCGSAVNT